MSPVSHEHRRAVNRASHRRDRRALRHQLRAAVDDQLAPAGTRRAAVMARRQRQPRLEHAWPQYHRRRNRANQTISATLPAAPPAACVSGRSLATAYTPKIPMQIHDQRRARPDQTVANRQLPRVATHLQQLAIEHADEQAGCAKRGTHEPVRHIRSAPGPSAASPPASPPDHRRRSRRRNVARQRSSRGQAAKQRSPARRSCFYAAAPARVNDPSMRILWPMPDLIFAGGPRVRAAKRSSNSRAASPASGASIS